MYAFLGMIILEDPFKGLFFFFFPSSSRINLSDDSYNMYGK